MIRKDDVRRVLRDKKGASVLVAIIILFVLLLLAASLLLASYSLFRTAQKQNSVTQCHELALSISETLGEQLTESMGSRKTDALNADGTPQYVDYTAEEFVGRLKDGTIEKENPFWYYLRCNLLQYNKWPYYDAESGDFNQSADVAWRNYSLAFQDTEQVLKDYEMKVTVYWESDSREVQGSGSDTVPYLNASPDVTVAVVCRRGEAESTVTSKYALNVEQFLTADGQESSEEKTLTSAYGTVIYCQENWSFRLLSRK